MKILIITQKVNKDDTVLGFFIRWIEEFAKQTEKVTVICLEEGKHGLPTRVLSLGKEKGVGRLGRVFRLYKYIWQHRKDYDAVLVHMTPVYVCISGWFFKILNKDIFLWYTHKNVDLKLKIANILSKKIFTASEESLKLKTNKKVTVGHGIDTELFKPEDIKIKNNKIITVGRISKIKNIDRLIEIFSELNDFYLTVVGVPIYKSDFGYFKNIKKQVKDYGLENRIIFEGSVNQENLPEKYNQANIFINLSDTGSLDKVILEAMSCGLCVVTTNKSAKELEGIKFVENYNKDSLVDIVRKIKQSEINLKAREFVIQNHNIDNLVKNILMEMKK